MCLVTGYVLDSQHCAGIVLPHRPELRLCHGGAPTRCVCDCWLTPFKDLGLLYICFLCYPDFSDWVMCPAGLQNCSSPHFLTPWVELVLLGRCPMPGGRKGNV